MDLDKIYRGDLDGWQKVDDNFQKLSYEESGLKYISLSGGASSSALYGAAYEKILRTVSWSGRIKAPKTSTLVQIATLPIGVSPQSEIFINLDVVGSQLDLYCRLLIAADGTVSVYSCNTDVQYFSLDNITYFTKK